MVDREEMIERIKAMGFSDIKQIEAVLERVEKLRNRPDHVIQERDIRVRESYREQVRNDYLSNIL